MHSCQKILVITSAFQEQSFRVDEYCEGRQQAATRRDRKIEEDDYLCRLYYYVAVERHLDRYLKYSYR